MHTSIVNGSTQAHMKLGSPHLLDIELIRIDGGTQSRVELNQETVADYAEAYKAGAKFPPVIVYFDGSERWLADGFHRYFGAKAAGLAQIYAEVTPGTQRDAIRCSLGANGSHGVRRTNADKRKAVLVALNDAEWSSLPHKDIAAMCDVSREYVSRLASEIELSCDRSQDANRKVSRNGKTYDQDTSKIGKKPAVEIIQLPAKEQAKAIHAPKAAIEGHMSTTDELIADMEETQAANAKLEEQVAAMQADDKGAEIAKLVTRVHGLEGRISQLMTQLRASEGREKAYSKTFHRLCKLLNAESHSAIIKAVEGFVAESA